MLLRLSPTKANTGVSDTATELTGEEARMARLLAERDEAKTITWPDSLRQLAGRGDTAARQAMTSEAKLFQVRLALQQAKVAALVKQRQEVGEEIDGERAIEASAVQRIALFNEEKTALQKLLEQGLVPRPRLLQLERSLAEVEGRRADVAAEMARLAAARGVLDVQILGQEADHASEISEQLCDSQKKVLELSEELNEKQDVLGRTEVRAPEDGIITDLRVHTRGGVINSGEPLMDLMPDADRLVVMTQVRPEDIKNVRIGLPGSVRLTAFNMRSMPALTGLVTYVSPDRLTDKRTERPYYAATIHLDEAQVARLRPDDLKAGMEATAIIRTGSSTVALYALSPIFNSFRSAFRDK